MVAIDSAKKIEDEIAQAKAGRRAVRGVVMYRIRASRTRFILGPVALAIALAASTHAFSETTYGVRTGFYKDASAGFIGGIGWQASSGVYPYLQAKVTISNNDEAVVAFELRC